MCRRMNYITPPNVSQERGGGADVPLFETSKTNTGTQPKMLG